MSVTDASAVPGPPAGAVRFIGPEREFWRIVLRGAVLLMVTLGLYRFWLATDIRRFLWANTEIDGQSLEYSGTALELAARLSGRDRDDPADLHRLLHHGARSRRLRHRCSRSPRC